MTRTSIDSSDNKATVIPINRDVQTETIPKVRDNPIPSWYKDLALANAKALHHKEKLQQRIHWVENRVPIEKFTVDSIQEYHKLHYTLWTEEVMRLSSLIQAYHITRQYASMEVT